MCLPACFLCCEAMAEFLGAAGSEAPVAIGFGLDVAQNDIHTKHAFTLVMKFVQRELEF